MYNLVTFSVLDESYRNKAIPLRQLRVQLESPFTLSGPHARTVGLRVGLGKRKDFLTLTGTEFVRMSVEKIHE